MNNPDAKRRALGVLAVLFTIITVVAIWNLSQTERSDVTPI
jgi:hypothetical protein